MSKKKALLVGINYPGTDHQLNGCVNDVMAMSQVLTQYFGFTNPKDKRVITNKSATTTNILQRLEWLVDGAQSGDYLYFHYSGHGSQIIDTSYDDDDEPDGLDEIICPVDLNWRDNVVTDDNLKAIFDKVPVGVHLTVMLDCCHSGSGIDASNVYQPYGAVREIVDLISPNKSRALAMPPDIANRGFGLEIKPKKRAVSRNPEVGLLISGCQSTQTSQDAWIHNRYMGAATFFLIENLKKFRWDVTHKTLVAAMNKDLKKFGYPQRPELDGNAVLFDTKFLK